MKKMTYKLKPQNRIERAHHDNGKVKSETPYANGKKHGLETWWWDNGKKRSEEMRRDGKRHGVWTYWYENGKKQWEIMWKYGKKHGLATNWYENGNKQTETYYLNDKPYARIHWDEEGNVFKTDFPNQPPQKNQTLIQTKKQTKDQITQITNHHSIPALPALSVFLFYPNLP